MNKYEESLVNSVKGVTNVKCTWKVFASPCVKPGMKLTSEKEKKLYEVVKSYLLENGNTLNVTTTENFTTMFVEWDNGKLIENVNNLVTPKDLDKVLKFFFLNERLNMSKNFCLAMNENDPKHVYLIPYSSTVTIYYIKEEEEKTEGEEGEKENDLDNLDKIAVLINSINSLSKGFSVDEKKQIVDMLKKSLGLKAEKVEKKSGKKSA